MQPEKKDRLPDDRAAKLTALNAFATTQYYIEQQQRASFRLSPLKLLLLVLKMILIALMAFYFGGLWLGLSVSLLILSVGMIMVWQAWAPTTPPPSHLSLPQGQPPVADQNSSSQKPEQSPHLRFERSSALSSPDPVSKTDSPDP